MSTTDFKALDHAAHLKKQLRRLCATEEAYQEFTDKILLFHLRRCQRRAAPATLVQGEGNPSEVAGRLSLQGARWQHRDQKPLPCRSSLLGVARTISFRFCQRRRRKVSRRLGACHSQFTSDAGAVYEGTGTCHERFGGPDWGAYQFRQGVYQYELGTSAVGFHFACVATASYFVATDSPFSCSRGGRPRKSCQTLGRGPVEVFHVYQHCAFGSSCRGHFRGQ